MSIRPIDAAARGAATGGAKAGAGGKGPQEEHRQRAYARAEERRQRFAVLSRQAEEVDEEAERDRGHDREQHAAAAPRVVGAVLLDGREDRASESNDGAAERQPGRPLPRREREPERDHGPAGGERRDDAHRPDRKRLVVGGEPDPASETAQRADPERARVEVEPVGREPAEERDEPGSLRENRDGHDGDAAGEEAAEEVRAAPGQGRTER